MKFFSATFLFVFFCGSLFAQLQKIPEKAIPDSTVYPLPANGSVTFYLGKLENPEVAFLVMWGEGNVVSLQHGIADDSGRVELDVASLPAGVYLVEITCDGKCFSVILPVNGPSMTCWRLAPF